MEAMRESHVWSLIVLEISKARITLELNEVTTQKKRYLSYEAEAKRRIFVMLSLIPKVRVTICYPSS